MKDELFGWRVMRIGLVGMMVLAGWLMLGRSALAAPTQELPEEPYSQVFTEEMAAEIAAWVLEAYPELPFAEPEIEIHEDGIVCRGVIEILGIDVAASGRVMVFLEDGKVNGRIEELEAAGMRVPRFLQKAIGEVRSLYDAASWDVKVTKVELREGELLVEGVYRNN